MPRLYDIAVAHGIESPAWDPTDGIDGSSLGADAVFIIDNVADYYYMGSEQDEWCIERDFPNLAPPFSVFWMEMRYPTHINRKGTVEVLNTAGARRAAFAVEGTRLDDGGWSLRAAALLEVHQRCVGPLGMIQLRIDPDGKGRAWGASKHAPPCADVPVAIAYASRLRGERGEEIKDDLVQSVVDTFKPFALAISFMHCKNVDQREIDQPAFDRQVWHKKHRRPLVRYRVLDIDPMRRVLKSKGSSEETGLKRALHICRGHFATYTEDAPLFGRPTGTGAFWKPQHIRGSPKQGAVVKDYRVHAPPTEKE